MPDYLFDFFRQKFSRLFAAPGQCSTKYLQFFIIELKFHRHKCTIQPSVLILLFFKTRFCPNLHSWCLFWCPNWLFLNCSWSFVSKVQFPFVAKKFSRPKIPTPAAFLRFSETIFFQNNQPDIFFDKPDCQFSICRRALNHKLLSEDRKFYGQILPKSYLFRHLSKFRLNLNPTLDACLFRCFGWPLPPFTCSFLVTFCLSSIDVYFSKSERAKN